ncbi:hypothetical protein CWI37_0912p0010 [Hamiltosporidium tvaerminnensis]|uniref:Rad21/Rec8-like protein C-terminal eukaryotic domain-containing protein n=1 Tax=Hamiltosporidium tvaerminnensis TaxID=1176355 RepID=A0A4Q9L1Q4_9MICR|nr:hypothetical protein CWI37_0912p0010 [Hamiltosporidium tvaerminnensis]
MEIKEGREGNRILPVIFKLATTNNSSKGFYTKNWCKKIEFERLKSLEKGKNILKNYSEKTSDYSRKINSGIVEIIRDISISKIIFDLRKSSYNLKILVTMAKGTVKLYFLKIGSLENEIIGLIRCTFLNEKNKLLYKKKSKNNIFVIKNCKNEKMNTRKANILEDNIYIDDDFVPDDEILFSNSDPEMQLKDSYSNYGDHTVECSDIHSNNTNFQNNITDSIAQNTILENESKFLSKIEKQFIIDENIEMSFFPLIFFPKKVKVCKDSILFQKKIKENTPVFIKLKELIKNKEIISDQEHNLNNNICEGWEGIEAEFENFNVSNEYDSIENIRLASSISLNPDESSCFLFENKFNLNEKIVFSELVAGYSKRNAYEYFFKLLFLAQKDVVSLKQKYDGEIYIIRNPGGNLK